MFEKFGITKDNALKLIVMLIIAAVVMLTLSILNEDYDSREQIISESDDKETMLCSILSEVKGVGEVNVMLEYKENKQVSGVIVTAEGADNPVTKQNIIKGVSTLFDIPVSNVIVFEKNQKGKVNEDEKEN